MDGLFNLANKLFDISIEPADGLAPVRSPSRFTAVMQTIVLATSWYMFLCFSRCGIMTSDFTV